jgi:transglutaminase 1
LLDQSAFNVACMANVEDTDYEYFAQDDFRVRKPDIKFSFTGTPTHDKAIEVFVRLENPLPISLNKGTFQIEGSGIDKPIILKVSEVPPAGLAEVRFAYKPPYVTSKAVLEAKFTSKELDDVDGFKVFEIKPAEGNIIKPDRSHNEVIRRTDVIH